ncbi:alpha/beta hydrolase [Streptomyces sp. MNU103]|uniref:alpha/beta hydrolase n=1 Tax=Streptomyces sp. MNU103 TaxID=2560024 RepID=UPI001E61D755|nr:alpha/beta hydrolase [Streptomyces sp. MNU103]
MARQYTSQAEAIRANVDAWAAWAGERDGVFGLGTDGDAVIASVERLAAALHACPVGGVDRTVLDGAVGNGATHRPLWDQLAWLVVALTAGDARAAQTAWLLAAPDGEQPKPGDTHVPGLVEATTCEGVWSRDLETYFADMRDFRDRCPYGYGVSRAQPWVATFRTDRPREAMTVLRGDDCAPGLIVAAEGNPTLAHRGGRAMATLFGDRLVTVADDGSNEMFAVRGNSAVDALVTAYFVDGRPGHGRDGRGHPRPAPEATAAQDGPVRRTSSRRGPTHRPWAATWRLSARRPRAPEPHAAAPHGEGPRSAPEGTGGGPVCLLPRRAGPHKPMPRRAGPYEPMPREADAAQVGAARTGPLRLRVAPQAQTRPPRVGLLSCGQTQTAAAVRPLTPAAPQAPGVP